MSRQYRRPRRWILYLFFAGFLALMALESIKPEPPDGHEIIFIGGIVAIYIGLMLWTFANARAIEDERDLQQDADIHKRRMPVSEQQATYWLATIRRHKQLQIRNGSHDKTT